VQEHRNRVHGNDEVETHCVGEDELSDVTHLLERRVAQQQLRDEIFTGHFGLASLFHSKNEDSPGSCGIQEREREVKAGLRDALSLLGVEHVADFTLG